jgi:hypothetical protein
MRVYTFLGQMPYANELHPGEHEPRIDRAALHQAQLIIECRATFSRSPEEGSSPPEPMSERALRAVVHAGSWLEHRGAWTELRSGPAVAGEKCRKRCSTATAS